jgi:AcrR family transcriptional regulator
MRNREARKQEQAEFIRNRFIEAAWAVIATGGAGAFTMEEVARKAGYSVGSIYNYFGGKDELLVGVLDWAGKRALDALVVDVPGPAPVEQLLAWHIRNLFREAERMGSVFFDMVSRFHDLPASAHRRLHENGLAHYRAMLARLTELLVRILPPELKVRSVDELAWTLSGLIRAEADRWFLEGPGFPLSERAGWVAAFFLRGVAGAEAHDTPCGRGDDPGHTRAVRSQNDTPCGRGDDQ